MQVDIIQDYDKIKQKQSNLALFKNEVKYLKVKLIVQVEIDDIKDLRKNQKRIESKKMIKKDENKSTDNNTSLRARLPQIKQQSILGLKQLVENPNLTKMNTKDQFVSQIFISQSTPFKYCSKVTIYAPFQKVYEYLVQATNRVRIFSDMVSLDQQTIIEDVVIQSHVYQLCWPLFDRQFIMAFCQQKLAESATLAWKSVDYVPEKGQEFDIYWFLGQERSKSAEPLIAKCEISGFLIQKLSEQKTKVSYGIEATLGEAGDKILKGFLHQQTNCVRRLKEKLQAIQKLLRLQQQNSSK